MRLFLLELVLIFIRTLLISCYLFIDLMICFLFRSSLICEGSMVDDGVVIKAV